MPMARPLEITLAHPFLLRQPWWVLAWLPFPRQPSHPPPRPRLWAPPSSRMRSSDPSSPSSPLLPSLALAWIPTLAPVWVPVWALAFSPRPSLSPFCLVFSLLVCGVRAFPRRMIASLAPPPAWPMGLPHALHQPSCSLENYQSCHPMGRHHHHHRKGLF